MPKLAGQKPAIVKILQLLHFLVFLTLITFIILMHNLPANTFQILRIPTFLQQIDPFLVFSYPSSLFIYQITLILFLAIAFINSLGLFFYSARFWRLVSDLSSFLGLFVVWSVVLFFILSLSFEFFTTSENVQTAFVYVIIAFFLFILDLITFFVDENHLGRKFLRRYLKNVFIFDLNC